MARVSTYLNFMGNTEEAFTFYKDVFGTEFIGDIARMGDAPSNPGMPESSGGAYWGVCLDRFGIQWMINVTAS